MDIEVSFSPMERPAKNYVTETVKDTFDSWGECYLLKPISKLKTIDPNYHLWAAKSKACVPSKFLFGPASLRHSRTIIYPCEKGKCQIQCSCFKCLRLCGEILSKTEMLENHRVYHVAPHLDCEFCIEVLRNIESFSYKKAIGSRGVVIDAWQFSHDKQYYPFLDKRTKGLKCSECDKSFSKASHRKRHFLNIHFQQKFECPDCKKLFGRLDNLNLHKRNKHKASEESVKDVDKQSTSNNKVNRMNGSTKTEIRNNKVNSIEVGQVLK